MWDIKTTWEDADGHWFPLRGSEDSKTLKKKKRYESSVCASACLFLFTGLFFFLLHLNEWRG